MTIGGWLRSAAKQLEAADIATARLDSIVLLEDCLQKNRAFVLAHLEDQLQTADEKVLAKNIARRVLHEPLAYIRGKTEFYGRDFVINHDMLEPRPETETMIDCLKELELPAKAVIVDLGTGSGAIAVTAKLELPDTEVTAIDIDTNCLQIAQQNAAKQTANIEFLESDLLAQFQKPVDVILANLPYVPDDYQINKAAMQEPKLAIFGGADGLDLYRRMFAHVQSFTQMPKYILTESLPPQHDRLTAIAKSAGYKLQKTDDFIQVFVIV